jgi:hypothetical protein
MPKRPRGSDCPLGTSVNEPAKALPNTLGELFVFVFEMKLFWDSSQTLTHIMLAWAHQMWER